MLHCKLQPVFSAICEACGFLRTKPSTSLRRSEVEEKEGRSGAYHRLWASHPESWISAYTLSAFVGLLNWCYVNTSCYIYLKLLQSINIQVSAAIFMNVSKTHVALVAVTFSITDEEEPQGTLKSMEGIKHQISKKSWGLKKENNQF